MLNELLPTNIGFGTVVGRFGSAPLIAGDADGFPDFSPAAGLTVTFTPSTAAVIDATASPAPVTIEMVPIVCGLDTQGYLVGGDGQRGVKLIATDDTDINPSGWTYSVTFLRGGAKVAAFRDFSMSLPSGTTKDIALTIPVPSSSGVSLSQAQAAEAAAVSAASQASAAAATAIAATATKVDKNTLNFNVKDYGATGNGTTDDKAAIVACMNAATAAGRARIVFFPPGTYRVDGGLSMSGQSCQLQGSGSSFVGSAGAGTVIKATNQTGPALDFLGFIWPENHRGRISFGKFALLGDGLADPTVTHHGIRIGDATAGNSAMSTQFHDISISLTGGIPLKMERVYLCDFDRITIVTPVGVVANDVPYILGNNVNSNNFTRIGLRSLVPTGNVGASGAVIIDANATYPSYGNNFDKWWYEQLTIPTNGCAFVLRGHTNIIADHIFSDCVPEAGSTNTCLFKIEPSAVDNFGGNIFRGRVPGGGSTAHVNTGIIVSQAHNYINGVKGYKGANVTLLAGADYTTAILGGSESTATDPAFINTGGITTATLIDYRTGYDNTATSTAVASLTPAVSSLQGMTLKLANYLVPTSAIIGTDSNADGLSDGFTNVNYGTQVGDTYTQSIVGGNQRQVSAYGTGTGSRRMSATFSATAGKNYMVVVPLINVTSGVTTVEAVSDINGTQTSFVSGGSVSTIVGGSGSIYYRATASTTATRYVQVGSLRVNSTTAQLDITKILVVDVAALGVDAPNVATMTNAQLAAFITLLASGNGPTIDAAHISDATAVGRAVLVSATQAAARSAIGAGTGIVDVQTFTTSGTWTKPAGCTLVTGTIIASGSGGGSGRRGAAGTIRCGGGGGGGGGVTRFTIPASSVTGTVAVTVAPGGAGGIAVTADSTNGNAGTNGAASSFGAYARASGGAGGGGGTNATGSAGSAGAGSSFGAAGAAASTTGGVGGLSGFAAGGAGGAAGGGITSGNVPANGGAGGGATTVKIATAAGGVVDGPAPGAADAGIVGAPFPGAAGGGGAASITTAAQAGATAGPYGSGGSGGGASLDGNNSGAGGAGSDGIVVVISY